jgi:hypothetical protein
MVASGNTTYQNEGAKQIISRLVAGGEHKYSSIFSFHFTLTLLFDHFCPPLREMGWIYIAQALRGVLQRR